MTKKRFIKHLRSIGASEKVIRNYTELVAKFGGAQSYQSIYDMLKKYIIERMLMESPPTQINYIEMPKMEFDISNYQLRMYDLYGAKPIEPREFIYIKEC